MEKEKLIKELKEQFDLTKKRLGFKTTYEKINDFTYIEDAILSQGYVSNRFSRQMINRIVETYYSWINELYNWASPSPYNMIVVSEAKKISEAEKKEVILMIDQIMYFFRKNKRIAFEGLIEKEEGKFVDELIDFGYDKFMPFMFKYTKKFELGWQDEMKK